MENSGNNFARLRPTMDYHKNVHAGRLFDGIANRYDLWSELFSFFQIRRWRHHLVSHLDVGPGDMVMDLCTGTGPVAMELTRRYGSRVVGVDLSVGMLEQCQRTVHRAGRTTKVDLIRGRAEGLPFPRDCFDAVCFTYLFRYVQDPKSTLREVVRVLRPGGTLVSLEFGVPPNLLLRGLWYIYTRGVLPLLASPVSRGWREVGAFLGPSISRFYRTYDLEQIRELWDSLGIHDAKVHRLSLGGAVVMWGRKS